MHLKSTRRRWVVATLGVIAFVGLIVVFVHDAVLEAVLPPLARSAGYDVKIGSLHLGTSDAVVTDLDVHNLHGEPVATVAKIAIGFDARDLLPGGKTLFGLRSIDVESPHVTLIHHRDGTYNIAVPASTSTASPAPLAPFDATVHVSDGSVSIVADEQLYTETRRLGIEHLAVDGAFHAHAPSSYDVHLSVVEAGRAYPISGHGDLDDARGIENNRFRAAEIPIGPLVDYALNTATVHITRGSLVDLDARYFGLNDRSGTMQRHLGVAGRLVDFTLQLGFLAKPFRNGSGEVYAYDDGLTLPKMTGTVADVPVTVAGGIYDFAKPTFRLGVAGSGALARLVTLSDAAKKFPVGGTMGFGLLVVGDATAPLTLARFASPRISYQRYPFDRVHGLVAIYGTDTTVLDAALAYAGVGVVARGNLRATKHTDVDFLASLEAPTAGLPYADTLLPGMTIAAQAVASGTDAKLETAGVVAGDSATQHLAGLFSIAPNGVGRVGPIVLDGANGESLLAVAALDRPHDDVDALVDARSLHLTNTRIGGLPGLALPNVPPFALALDASLGASLAGKNVGLAGSTRVSDASLRGVPLGVVALDATAFGGSDPNATRVAATGTYDGRLDDLARLGGGGVAAHGDVSLAIAALAVGRDAIAQVRDTRLDRVSIGGVALQGLAATVGLHGRTVDVYGARADLGPGSVVASGSFGDGGTISLATSAIDLASLGAIPNLPVRHGTVSAIASVGGTAAAPTLDAGVVASDVRYRTYDAGGSTSLAYGGDRLSIAGGLFDLQGAVADLDGSVGGLRPGAIRPELDLTATASAVDIGALARTVKAPLYPTGSLDANLHVTGSATAPVVAGRIAIPEGSIDGLDYRNAAVALDGTAANVRATDGAVTVGTSRLAFAGDLAARRQRLTLAAPRLDLADFDDAFDAADTLAGHGELALALTHDDDRLATRGTLRLTGVQLSRIPVGDARAFVNTSGRTITTNARVGDASGLVTLDGGVTLPADHIARDTVHRTNVALTATASNVDLQHWLPIFGIKAPVSGIVNASARANGVYPALAVTANAGLTQGLIGKIPVQRANLVARSSAGRITISSATFDVPNLATTLMGSVGLTPAAPVDLTLRSSTADIGALAKSVGIVPKPLDVASAPPVRNATPAPQPTYDVSGASQVAVTLTGTAARPRIGATLDVQKLRYAAYTIPRVHAEADIADLAMKDQSGRFEVRNTEIDLTSGRITASGSAPFRSAPAGLGPQNAPVALALGFEAIDLGQFGALLPKNTKLAGRLAGTLGLDGTVQHPEGSGRLDVTKLSYLGPQEVQKIQNGSATVVLAGRTLSLERAHVDSGGGSIDATAKATVPDLGNPAGTASYVANAVFNHPELQLPNLYRGRLDGTIGVSRAAGGVPVLNGNVTASDARIPYTALLPPAATGTPGPPPPPVDLALGVTAGKDVRVQSGPVDIGAQGHIDVTGTVSSPKASGQFVATGGTVDFYRDFRLQNGTVAFSPDDGVIPNVTAEATTSISSPQTNVTLNVTGLATSLNVDLTSDPAYSKAQILGLLVGLNNYGAVAGVAGSQGGPAPTAGSLASNYATGQLSTLFQRQLLEPLSANLGQAIGGNLGVNYDPGGGFDLNARRAIAKHVDAVFAETFGYPQRTSYGIVATPRPTTAIQLTIFQSADANQFDVAPQALQSSNNSVTDAEPQHGKNGYSFSLQRKF